jgi:hypothetical protein
MSARSIVASTNGAFNGRQNWKRKSVGASLKPNAPRENGRSESSKAESSDLSRMQQRSSRQAR